MAEVEVRALGPEDVDAMEELDEQSGFDAFDNWRDYVEDEDEENCYLWGVFVDGELVGFCSTSGGGDDEFSEAIVEHPLYGDGTTYLMDVYIDPAYRDQGYGSRLVHDALLGYWDSEGEQQATFLDLYFYFPEGHNEYAVGNKLIGFFEGLGFEVISDEEGDITDTCMVLDPANFRDPADEDGDDEDMDDEDNE